MIPRRAFFLWVGDDELPWLRQLALDSFRKQNPDWQVDLIRVPEKVDLLAAQSTDIFRYCELATTGGMYFDTDIVFFRPVPDKWLDADVAVTLDKSLFQYEPGLKHASPENEHKPGFNNLAMMGASPTNPFFDHVYRAALARYEWLAEDNVDVKKLIYQAFGTELLNREFYGRTQDEIAEMFDCRIVNVPANVVLPVPWYHSFKLFNGTPFEPPEETIGVHWFGGSVDAKRYCQQMTRETYMRRKCYLSDAIARATA